MAFSGALAWLLVFVSFIPSCLSLGLLPMNVESHSCSEAWQKEKTFTSKHSINEIPHVVSGKVTYEDVERVAHASYNWIIANFPDPADRQTESGETVVATFFDPSTQSFYSSSVPRGPQLQRMIRLPQAWFFPRATAWWNQIKRIAALNGNTMDAASMKLYAADGAFFYWETENARSVRNGKYPDGTMIAAWGKHASAATDSRTVPCLSGGFPGDFSNAHCESVISNLNVNFLSFPNDGGLSLGAGVGEVIEATWRNLVRRNANVKRATSACPAGTGPTTAATTTTTGTGTHAGTGSPGTTPPITTKPTTGGASPTGAGTSTFSCWTDGPDPDDGDDLFTCSCFQGSRTEAVFADKNSCPWTGFPLTDPPATPITATTSPKQTDPTQLFKSTSGTVVVACETSSVYTTFDQALTSCVGTSVTISTLPHVTVAYGSSTQSVGALSNSDDAIATFKSMLTAACPTPHSDGATTSCTSTPTLSNIEYIYSYTTEECDFRGGGCIQTTPTAIANDGTLSLDPGENSYTSEGILNSLIELSSQTLAKTLNCKPVPNSITKRSINGTIVDTGLERRGIPDNLCSVVEYAQPYFFDALINPAGFAGNIETTLKFQIGQAQQQLIDEGILLACGGIAELLIGLFEAILPELAPLELVGTEAIESVCGQIANDIKGG